MALDVLAKIFDGAQERSRYLAVQSGRLTIVEIADEVNAKVST